MNAMQFLEYLRILSCLILIEDPAPSPLRVVEHVPGLTFRHQNGSRGKHDLPEIMGGGLALIDVDGDGWLDLYFCKGNRIDDLNGDHNSPSQLFRNCCDGTYVDTTTTAGAPGPPYAMGTAVGDFDHDGRDDLFVTGWRGQRLYRNLGGGTFADVTDRAGLTSDLWSTSAAFADLDGDGDLDLMVVTYVDYDPKLAPYCAAPDGRRDFCGPEAFRAQPDRLYRNNGDATFTEISKSAGLDLPDGRGLGVLIADLVGDSKLDIFIANDGSACRLFENLGNLKFRDVAPRSGVAFDGQGEAIAAMGIALGDINGDALPDLVVTNFLGRSTVAFQALPSGGFSDRSAALGLAPTRPVLGFGVVLEDFDGDGRLDLLQANGHVLDRARLGVPYEMRPTLLLNHQGRLTESSLTNAISSLGRGLVVGDLDHDSRPDAILTSINASPTVLKNSSQGHYVTIRLKGIQSKPIGAKLTAEFQGHKTVRQLVAGGSYLSTSSDEISIGLGRANQIDRLTILWPSGQTEVWNDLKAGRIAISQGSGESIIPR